MYLYQDFSTLSELLFKNCGVTLCNIKVTHLGFVNDVVLSLDSLVVQDVFHNETKPLGFEVKIKTKFLDLGGLLGKLVQSIHACTDIYTFTESFTYLGM